MRHLIIGLIFLIGCTAEPARQALRPQAAPQRVGEALSNLNHPVSTTSARAQRHFDDGLTLVYAFNHDEAVKSFEKALAADPKLAMAHWGIALAVGPNYNVDVDAEREKQGYDEIQKAAALAKEAPQQEKDYIAALARRFSNADKPDYKKLAADYAVAAGELAKKYPDDLDAQTLYADAMMNLRPWALYTSANEPVEGTATIVSTLEQVLKRDPDHLGACHLYIHAVEASKQPHRALEAAARLPGLAPDCGHLVHMPSHIYSRVGDYESAVTSNEAAVDVDRVYLGKNPEMKTRTYGMMYFPHNVHFLAYAESWQGNRAAAMKWAQQLYDLAAPHVTHMPMLEAFTAVPIALEVKFRRWDDILASSSPDQKTMPITSAMHHFARGMALASKGNLADARREREQLAAIESSLPADAMMGMLNKAHHVLDIASRTLDAKIASEEKRWSDAKRLLREAAKLEDTLTYMEPPDWLMPTREALGGVLLQAGRAAEAEKVFREDLDRGPRNARSLFGLVKALEAQKKSYEADLVRREFEAAWKNADSKLVVEDL
jgi:Tfp pilus assembly protein PilF